MRDQAQGSLGQDALVAHLSDDGWESELFAVHMEAMVLHAHDEIIGDTLQPERRHRMHEPVLRMPMMCASDRR